MAQKEDILNFWFDGVDETTTLVKEASYTKKWFGQDKKLDAGIKEKFANDIETASKGVYDPWCKQADGWVAIVLLLHQFPRSAYRNTSQAYAYELKALEYDFKALKSKIDETLPLYQRMFLYVPLVHSENMEIQDMSLMYARRLVRKAEDEEDRNLSYYQDFLSFAQAQYDIIKKFGRFPHRNSILDRRATSEEQAFASQPEITF